MTTMEKETLKNAIIEAAKTQNMNVSSAFYFLKGERPELTVKDACEIVSELRLLPMNEYPFRDY